MKRLYAGMAALFSICLFFMCVLTLAERESKIEINFGKEFPEKCERVSLIRTGEYKTVLSKRQASQMFRSLLGSMGFSEETITFDEGEDCISAVCRTGGENWNLSLRYILKMGEKFWEAGHAYVKIEMNLRKVAKEKVRKTADYYKEKIDSWCSDAEISGLTMENFVFEESDPASCQENTGKNIFEAWNMTAVWEGYSGNLYMIYGYLENNEDYVTLEEKPVNVHLAVEKTEKGQRIYVGEPYISFEEE